MYDRKDVQRVEPILLPGKKGNQIHSSNLGTIFNNICIYVLSIWKYKIRQSWVDCAISDCVKRFVDLVVLHLFWSAKYCIAWWSLCFWNSFSCSDCIKSFVVLVVIFTTSVSRCITWWILHLSWSDYAHQKFCYSRRITFYFYWICSQSKSHI